MKKDIHPAKRLVTVVMNDGTRYQTHMCLNKDTLVLDIDPTTHPAWRDGGPAKLMDSNIQVSRFGARYGNLGFEG
jgi:large subunit ribosomal protein L31